LQQAVVPLGQVVVPWERVGRLLQQAVPWEQAAGPKELVVHAGVALRQQGVLSEPVGQPRHLE